MKYPLANFGRHATPMLIFMISCLTASAQQSSYGSLRGQVADALGGLIVHTHMNNNDGKIDIHMGFDHGVLDYNQLLPEIRALPMHPTMTLEMDEVDFMKASLSFMNLVKPYQPEFP